MTASPAISGAVMRIRQRAPFFASLLLFARILPSDRIETAATDGMSIFYNPIYFASLQPRAVEAVLVHEVLHCALGHVHRRGDREPKLWNYAADIVVNGMVAADNNCDLPPGAIRHHQLEHCSTEEVYRVLLRHARASADHPLVADLIFAEPGSESVGLPDSAPSGEKPPSAAATAQHWQAAVGHARLVSAGLGNRGQGTGGGGMELFFRDLGASQIDWRTLLWRFVVRTPTDFSGYDRRFIHEGLYLDDMQEESVSVNIAIDTSGSIGRGELDMFMSELAAIVRSYPNIDCELYFADAALYGPFPLSKSTGIPAPRGGGGTSFVPFFEKRDSDPRPSNTVSVYLTDGFGEFPPNAPRGEVLWVVTPGGRDSSSFPFGQVVRLADPSNSIH